MPAILFKQIPKIVDNLAVILFIFRSQEKQRKDQKHTTNGNRFGIKGYWLYWYNFQDLQDASHLRKCRKMFNIQAFLTQLYRETVRAAFQSFCLKLFAINLSFSIEDKIGNFYSSNKLLSSEKFLYNFSISLSSLQKLFKICCKFPSEWKKSALFHFNCFRWAEYYAF